MIAVACDMCGAPVEAPDLAGYGDAFLAHVRDAHPDLPFPDTAVRGYGQGLARTTGSTERLEVIGEVTVHPVTEDRITDWLDLFDHRVMAGTPQNASCYCLESHELGSGDEIPYGDWEARRAAMVERLRTGATVGYLAYVDGTAAGWVNASLRRDYSIFRRGDDADGDTIGVACFAIAPPYRGHRVAAALLARVIDDARARGAAAVEAYPMLGDEPTFRGAPGLYDDAGFTPVKVRQRDTVVRLEV